MSTASIIEEGIAIAKLLETEGVECFSYLLRHYGHDTAVRAMSQYLFAQYSPGVGFPPNPLIAKQVEGQMAKLINSHL